MRRVCSLLWLVSQHIVYILHCRQCGYVLRVWALQWKRFCCFCGISTTLSANTLPRPTHVSSHKQVTCTWHRSECVSKCRSSSTTCCGGRKRISSGRTRSMCKHMHSAHLAIPRMSLGNTAGGFLLSVPCSTTTAFGSSGCLSSVGILSLDECTSPLGILHSHNGRGTLYPGWHKIYDELLLLGSWKSERKRWRLLLAKRYCILCGFDRASSLICGNKMPTRWFLLQILLLAQHVSGTIMPIIRSSRVLNKWLLQQPANRTHNPQLHNVPTTWKPKHQIRQAATTCIILSSSWWWA